MHQFLGVVLLRRGGLNDFLVVRHRRAAEDGDVHCVVSVFIAITSATVGSHSTQGGQTFPVSVGAGAGGGDGRSQITIDCA